MKRLISQIKRLLTIGVHFVVLMAAIIKTAIKRVYKKIRKQKVEHEHLRYFITNRKSNSCNLTTLLHSLEKRSCNKLLICDILDHQASYQNKGQLLRLLPEPQEGTEIIAIPLAASAFSFFRHFITIIVDLREGIIEFYDSIGFSIAQYDKGTLWGPNCPKAGKLKLSELVEKAKEVYGIDKVIENRELHQQDFNQCALYVYDRIYKRGVKGQSFAAASKSPLTSKQAFI